MPNTPYWKTPSFLPSFSPIDRDVAVDVIVIGGGGTGITTAYLMKRAGFKVALLERGRCAGGDTGHTTAHLTCVLDQRIHKLISNFGESNARAVWDASKSAIALIAEAVATEKIECDFHFVNGYFHAQAEPKSSDDGASGGISELQKELQAAKTLGIESEYISHTPVYGTPGVRFPNQAKFFPPKYLAALLATIPGEGSYVFENTEAGEISSDPLVVHAGGFVVRGRLLVLATQAFPHEKQNALNAFMFEAKLSRYTSYVVGAKIPRDVPSTGLFWDTEDPYNYLRIDSENAAGDSSAGYAIFGGQDHKTGQASDTEEQYRKLEERFRSLMPQSEITHRWSGQTIASVDGLPYIGLVGKDTFVGTGFGGNGMTFGTLTAMMAVDALQGRENRWSKLFEPRRKGLAVGAWNYISENKDYPLHLIHDWFSKEKDDTGSVTKLERGAGSLFQLGGKRVAAFRANDGKYTVCSATCPHLGCTVTWNDAEKTWDCPCHGSRFHATGEIISGPAETRLEVIAKSGGKT